MNVNDKDVELLLRAFEVAKASDDPNAVLDPNVAVGAVIVAGADVVAASANRFPPRLRNSDRRIQPHSEERYYLIEHAERCAILDALMGGIALEGATMYSTRFPCIDCARAISYVGIRRLVVGAGFRHELRWVQSQRAAYQLILSQDIRIRFLKLHSEIIQKAASRVPGGSATRNAKRRSSRGSR